MSLLGSYLGEDPVTIVYITPSSPETIPVDSPFDATAPEYVDHLSKGIERLCEYSRSGDVFDAAEFLKSIGFSLTSFDIPLGGGLG